MISKKIFGKDEPNIWRSLIKQSYKIPKDPSFVCEYCTCAINHQGHYSKTTFSNSLWGFFLRAARIWNYLSNGDLYLKRTLEKPKLSNHLQHCAVIVKERLLFKNNFFESNFWGSGYYLRAMVNGTRTVYGIEFHLPHYKIPQMHVRTVISKKNEISQLWSC